MGKTNMSQKAARRIQSSQDKIVETANFSVKKNFMVWNIKIHAHTNNFFAKN